jgi:TonB family protein
MTGVPLDHLVATTFRLLADASARTLVVMGAAAVLLAAWRRPTVRMRAAVWTLVLVASLTMPGLPALVPALRVGVSTNPVVRTFAAVVETPESRTTLVPGGGSSVQFSGATGSSGSAPTPVPWRAIAWAIYLAGAVGLLVRIGVGWTITRRFGRRSVLISDAAALAEVAHEAARLGLTRAPRLHEHPDLTVPVTLAVWHPIVVLPTDWRDWAVETRRGVLAHELSHIGRADTLIRVLSDVYCAGAWLNPCAWWLRRTLADLAEQASDEAALEAGVSPIGYAETLLIFLGRLPGTPGRAAWQTAMAREGGLRAEARIDRVLAWQPRPAGRRRADALLACFVVLVTAVAASVTVTARSLAPAVAALPVESVSASPRGATRVGWTEPLVLAPSLRGAVPPAIRSGPAAPAASSAAMPRSELQGRPTEVPPTPGPPVPIASGFGAGAYRPGHGIQNPVLVQQVTPVYSLAALQRRLSGDVELEAVILKDGTVGDVHVVQSLDPTFGLDDEAIRAARQWLFRPAALNGQPVPIVVVLEVQFNATSTEQGAAAADPISQYTARPLGDTFAAGAYWPTAVGVTGPVVDQAVEPHYTAQAMRDHLQGVAEVEVVVGVDGTVSHARIVRSLDPFDGLDREAVAAAEKTTFKPGTLNGQPVPVVTTIEMTFRLHEPTGYL